MKSTDVKDDGLYLHRYGEELEIEVIESSSSTIPGGKREFYRIGTDEIYFEEEIKGDLFKIEIKDLIKLIR